MVNRLEIDENGNIYPKINISEQEQTIIKEDIYSYLIVNKVVHIDNDFNKWIIDKIRYIKIDIVITRIS